MKEKAIFNTLFKLGTSIEKAGNARIASVITLKKDIVSFGFNSIKSHPFQRKFGKNEESIYLHSEIDAIKNALKTISVKDFKYSSLYISRVKQNIRGGDFVCGLARPCVGCMKAIATFGINNIYYTEDNKNEFTCL